MIRGLLRTAEIESEHRATQMGQNFGGSYEVLVRRRTWRPHGRCCPPGSERARVRGAVSEPQSDREWVDLYVDQRDVYDAFVGRLEDLVELLLDDSDVSYDWVIIQRTPHDVGTGSRGATSRSYVWASTEGELRVAGVIGLRNNSSAADINDVIRREFTVDDESSLPIEEAAVRNERLGDEVRDRSDTSSPTIWSRSTNAGRNWRNGRASWGSRRGSR